MPLVASGADDLGGGQQIFVTPVRARADVGAVEAEATLRHPGRRVRIPGRRRERHQRFDGCEVEDFFVGESRGAAAREAGVGKVPDPAAFEESGSHLVEGEDPVPGLRFGHHVADRVAPRDRQGASRIDEFHRGAGGGPVPPRDERQHDVLARGPRREFPAQHHPAGRRRSQKNAAGGPAEAECGRSDADAERAVGAVGAAVAVGPRNHRARHYESLLGEVEVEDPVAGSREPGRAKLLGSGEIPADRGLPVVGLAPREDEVVVRDGGLARINGAPGDFPEGVDRERRGAVGSGQEVRRYQDAFSHRDRDPAIHPVGPEDLLGHGEPALLFGAGPFDLRLAGQGGEELPASGGEDAAGRPEFGFLPVERLRLVGAAERFVGESPVRRVEAEAVAIPGVLGRGGTLENFEAEVQGVPAEDVADPASEDQHERRARIPCDPEESCRAHLPRGPDTEPFARDHEVRSGPYPGGEIRHQVEKRPDFPALVERVQTLGNAVGGGCDLVGIDGVPFSPGFFRIPEYEGFSGDRRR